MSSLVAYGDSGSDISDSDEEQLPQSDTPAANHNQKLYNFNSAKLFGALPVPKSGMIKNACEEEDDEFLHKKEIPTEVPKKPAPLKKVPEKKAAQIFLPSLSSFNDDDVSNIQPIPKFKPASKGTGLLNLLPQPKSIQNIEQAKKRAFTNLVPDSVKNKKVVSNVSKSGSSKPPPTKTEPSKSSLSLIKYDSSDDSDDESNEKQVDFFSLNKTQEEYLPQENESITVDNTVLSTQNNHIIPEQDNHVPVHNIMEENQYIEQPQPIYYNEHEPVASSNMDIDNEALQKLAGSRAKRRGETMQIIDIDQKEILPDPREWLTKALTDDTSKRTSSSKRRGDEPTTQQRRKHQITYLAHQAKANEQELQNQWANNRLSKKQTQSKYGF